MAENFFYHCEKVIAEFETILSQQQIRMKKNERLPRQVLRTFLAMTDGRARRPDPTIDQETDLDTRAGAGTRPF